MQDQHRTLLLTRPEPQSTEFLAFCEDRVGRRIPTVIAPVIDIVPVGDLPELAGYDTLIFTSRNGVRRFGSQLHRRRVVTVGERTAALAREFGADATSLGATVDEFLTQADEVVGRSLYCRGVHVRQDLGALLGDRGALVEDVVVYDQLQQPLTRAARALLVGSDPVVMPVFSARSADLLSQNSMTAPRNVLALSDAVAASWRGGGQIETAREPTRLAMSEMIESLFSPT